MSIVTLFSASFAGGETVAAQVASALGYATLTDAELYVAAAKTYPLDAERFARALYDPPAFFNRVTREKEKGVAHLRLAMSEALERDDLVYHGNAMHLVPSTLTHVLRVGLPAKWEHRVRRAMSEKGWTDREAEKRLRKQDEVAAGWVYDLFGMSPWDERLYDVVLPLGEGTEAEAVATLVAHVRRPALATTKLAHAAVQDAILAAQVNIALVEKGHDVDVSAVDGDSTILIREVQHASREARAGARWQCVLGSRGQQGHGSARPALSDARHLCRSRWGPASQGAARRRRAGVRSHPVGAAADAGLRDEHRLRRRGGALESGRRRAGGHGARPQDARHRRPRGAPAGQARPPRGPR